MDHFQQPYKNNNIQVDESLSPLRDLKNRVDSAIDTGSNRLTSQGFTPESARFECLFILKKHLEGLIDECNPGTARHQFYRDYVMVEGDSYRSIEDLAEPPT
jgi:hypothetical protein